MGVTVTAPLQADPDQSPVWAQVVALVLSIVSCSELPSGIVLTAGVMLIVGVNEGVTQSGQGFPLPLPTV